MNVTANANFSGTVKLPGTVKLGTWDLSQSNIKKLIIESAEIGELISKTIKTTSISVNNLTWNGTALALIFRGYNDRISALEAANRPKT